jgi:hypothetical protein
VLVDEEGAYFIDRNTYSTTLPQQGNSFCFSSRKGRQKKPLMGVLTLTWTYLRRASCSAVRGENRSNKNYYPACYKEEVQPEFPFYCNEAGGVTPSL